ncbi:DJ-1/PfpI family protein [Cytophaga aurantiaca]|uniref:DJ-1/PfpI family protein n=1 Tax=Cytophaga aurantiaca TaxID=29530 RepID=UPI00036864C5|nr:DJ-1/PfpI family protein [Cytophaga aurantiaca]
MDKRIVMLLASEKFRDCEFIVPKAFFEQSGIKVRVASTKLTATGRFGFSVSSDVLIEYLNPADYDGIFFVGGAGSIEYIDNIKAKAVFEKFLELKKPIAAICAAPRNFLKWGLLKGKKCTGFNKDGVFSSMAKEYGAIGLPEEEVVEDGLILTANGPEASEACAIAFIHLLNK